MAILIQKNGLVESTLARIGAGYGAVHVRSADLGARWNGLVLDAPPRAYTRVNPLVCGQIFAEGQGYDGECILVVGGDADALSALVGQRTDVNVGTEGIAAKYFDRDGGQ